MKQVIVLRKDLNMRKGKMVYNHLMISGIYTIGNVIDNKVYVGKSTNIDRRLSRHERDLDAGKHKNTHLQQAWTKHGKHNFVFFRLELCEEHLLNEKERHWIKHYNSDDKKFGYNKTKGGDGGRLNDESLAKMAASQRGKKMSKASKTKIAAALTGVPRPQTVRDKISKTKTGEVKSKAHKTKISKTLKGRKLSLKTRTKMSETRKGRKQPKLVCPHCRKSGGTAMRRWHFDNCRVKNGT